MIQGVSCAVLAGGESRRMGKDKAGVELAGKPLIERVLATVAPLFDDVLISGREEKKAYPGTHFVADMLPGRGPAVGLHAAMTAARHAYVFAMACDMPFISPELIAMLAGKRHGVDIVVPRACGRLQPLCAVYSVACAPLLREQVEQGRRGLVEFIEHVPGLKVLRIAEEKLRKCDPGLKSFIDIDTTEALVNAEQALL